MEVEDLGHHISRRFNEDLERVRNAVLSMGGLVEDQLERAIKALSEGDSQLGLQVAEDDVKVNRMEVSIDEECSRILATRAPTAGDLRLVIAIIKTITDLERIGDEAEPLAQQDRAVLRYCYAGALLTAVLEGVEPEEGQARYVQTWRVDAENAALLVQGIRIVGE